MKTIENTDAVASIVHQIEEAAANADTDLRIIDSFPVGSHVRQGDVYLLAIDKSPSGTDWKGQQVAEGHTLGSRHVVSPWAKVTRPADYGQARNFGKSRQKPLVAFVGPVVTCDDRFTLSHPEHAGFDLPAGVYQVLYQSDPRTNRRVQD